MLAIDSRAPIAANNLAWMYAESGGNLDIALQLAQTAKAALETALDLNPNFDGAAEARKTLAGLR